MKRGKKVIVSKVIERSKAASKFKGFYILRLKGNKGIGIFVMYKGIDYRLTGPFIACNFFPYPGLN